MTDSPWTQTYSGAAYYPLEPHRTEYRLLDIAHALSNLCRYGGACRRFYSVAEHSVLVSLQVPPEHALQALMHDATEAYLVDVPKPIKALLRGYEEIEQATWRAIAIAFDLPVQMHESVHRADLAVLLAEKEHLLGRSPQPWCMAPDVEPARLGEIQCLAPREAKAMFLERFAVLDGYRKGI